MPSAVVDVRSPKPAAASDRCAATARRELHEFITIVENPQHLWEPERIISDEIAIPSVSGVYAWYFDEVPFDVPTADCLQVGRWTLLYVGVSEDSLRTRIRSQHIGGNAYGSTLRASVGALMRTELDLVPLPRGRRHKGYYFGDQERTVLTPWMVAHMRLVWLVCSDPRAVEKGAISRWSLPLNRRGNKSHAFYRDLGRLRAKLRREAWSSSQ